MAVDVLVNTDEITVLGSPPVVEVKLDIGATGQRGSKVFVGTGNPNLLTSSIGQSYSLFGQSLYINDLYINNSFGEEYSYMYQFISSLGTNTWVPVLKVNPTLYSNNFLTTFSNGNSTITIPIVNIVETSGTPLIEENFSIQHNISHSNPVASAISGISITGASNDQLSINFTASELNSSTWQDLNNIVTMHILITIVIPESEES